MKIVRWIIRIILFILVLVLVLDNRYKVQFDFYGIYTWNVPLIVICFIFLLLGICIGVIYGLFRSLELKTRIKLLQKDLDNARKTGTSAD